MISGFVRVMIRHCWKVWHHDLIKVASVPWRVTDRISSDWLQITCNASYCCWRQVRERDRALCSSHCLLGEVNRRHTVHPTGTMSHAPLHLYYCHHHFLIFDCTCLLPVAWPWPGGAGQVLWYGPQGEGASHAAVPWLECTGQLWGSNKEVKKEEEGPPTLTTEWKQQRYATDNGSSRYHDCGLQSPVCPV